MQTAKISSMKLTHFDLSNRENFKVSISRVIKFTEIKYLSK